MTNSRRIHRELANLSQNPIRLSCINKTTHIATNSATVVQLEFYEKPSLTLASCVSLCYSYMNANRALIPSHRCSICTYSLRPTHSAHQAIYSTVQADLHIPRIFEDAIKYHPVSEQPHHPKQPWYS